MKDTSKKALRRGHNEVNIRQRTDGRWEVRLSAGIDYKPASRGVLPPAATPDRKQSPFYSSKPTKSAHRAGAILCR